MPESKKVKARGGPAAKDQGKWRLRKAGSRSAVPALFTITEEEEGHRRKKACIRRKRVDPDAATDGCEEEAADQAENCPLHMCPNASVSTASVTALEN
uniref:Uncharacterized protein n=1 Tax=Knipowitschia caucasica TaxID=637954 RepID=A0AAV2KEH9_KNICA